MEKKAKIRRSKRLIEAEKSALEKACNETESLSSGFEKEARIENSEANEECRT
jgi:hypothetical protein